MFQPYTLVKDVSLLRTFSCDSGTPKMVVAASINQLKRLIYIYYMKYKGGPLSSYYNMGLLQVSHAMLKDHGDPDWRLYMSLCIRSWVQLYLSYPIYSAVAQSFLAMAMRDKLVSATVANDIMTQFTEAGRYHNGPEQPSATFVTDFDLVSTNPAKSRINAVAESFSEMALFDEFTTGEYFSHSDEDTAEGGGNAK
jgi:hypothetical protein